MLSLSPLFAIVCILLVFVHLHCASLVWDMRGVVRAADIIIDDSIK